MKIIYVVHDMNAGGVATIVNNLMLGISNKGHEVHLVVLKNVMPEVKILCENITILNITSKADYLRGILKLKKIVNKIDPDIIHSHTVLAHILVLLLKSFYHSNIRIVCTEHSSLTTKQNESLIFKIFSFLSEKTDKITFVSNFSLDSYIDKGILASRENAIVIYNGINKEKVSIENILKIKKELNISEELKTFCYIGRLSPEKNIEMMLRAFSFVDHCNIQLIIVGNGNVRYENELTTLVKQLKLKNIIFLGHRNDAIDIISSIDCLLLSSFVEGLPTVILEAHSQKKIAISTVCGGVKEIIKDELFLAENNNAYDFSKKINYYLSLSKEEKNTISERNYLLFESNFNIKLMIDNFYDLYQGMIDD